MTSAEYLPPLVQPSRLSAALGNFRQNWSLASLALPAIVLIILFNYLPMFGSVIAFQDYSPRTLFNSPFVGFKNFQLLFNSPVLSRLVTNTVLLNTMFILATTISAVTVAIMLNEVRSTIFKRIIQAFIFLPFFMGWTIVAMVLFGLIDYQVGTINGVLVRLGFERIIVTDKPNLWPWILMLIKVWKGVGAGSIVYLAALTGVDPQLHEAAAIDGANRWHRIRHVNLPALLPVIILLVLLDIGRIFFGDVGMIYAVIGDKAPLYPTTDVIDTYVLRALRQNANYGFSAAVSLAQAVLGFVFILGSNWAVKKYSERRGEDYSLF
jgi:putative aldouronate transport system permease protein